MSGTLIIKRASGVPVETKLLNEITKALLGELLAVENFELGIHLVRAKEMARVNETFLNHEGATDVITFDHSNVLTLNSQSSTPLHGELFVCYDVAHSQAKEFRTTWQSEIVRYVVHGVLHLQGFDDHLTADRRKMKCEEIRLVRKLTRRFPISKLASRRKSG